MNSTPLTPWLVVSVVWTILALFAALLMGSGFADEPGDTNGFARFGTCFVVFVLPGIAATVIVARAMHVRNRAASRTAGFPIEPLPRSGDELPTAESPPGTGDPRG